MSSIYRRRKLWWWRAYDRLQSRTQGRKVYRRQSLKTVSKDVARLKAAELDQQFYQPRQLVDGSLSLAEAVDAYLAATTARKTPAWQAEQAIQAKVLLGALPQLSVHHLTAAHAERALQTLHRERHWSNTTYNSYRKFLVTFCRWAKQHGYLWGDPLAALPRLKETEPSLVWVPYERWSTLCSLARRSKYSLAVEIGIYLGLRQKEIEAATAEDVDRKQQTLTVRAEVAKSRKSRVLPVPSGLLHQLPKIGPLVPGYREVPFQRDLNRWLHKMGYTGRGLGIHTLRHSFGVWMAGLVTSPFDLQQLMGHADIRTTMRYIHVHERRVQLDRIRQAMERSTNGST